MNSFDLSIVRNTRVFSVIVVKYLHRQMDKQINHYQVN